MFARGDVIYNSGGGTSGAESGSEADLYLKAVAIVKRDRKTSISYVQLRLDIGYNLAATLIVKMEQEGVITAPDVFGKRKIIDE